MDGTLKKAKRGVINFNVTDKNKLLLVRQLRR